MNEPNKNSDDNEIYKIGTVFLDTTGAKYMLLKRQYFFHRRAEKDRESDNLGLARKS